MHDSSNLTIQKLWQKFNLAAPNACDTTPAGFVILNFMVPLREEQENRGIVGDTDFRQLFGDLLQVYAFTEKLLRYTGSLHPTVN